MDVRQIVRSVSVPGPGPALAIRGSNLGSEEGRVGYRYNLGVSSVSNHDI